MEQSRRKFLVGGASAVAAGVVGASVVGCKKDEETSAPTASKSPKGAKAPKAMVGACGLSCMACPLMKAKKCKGCASGKDATAEMLEMKTCPVLQCAAKKKIAYCGTDCKKFTECAKLIGKPYDKTFMEMIAKRMDATA